MGGSEEISSSAKRILVADDCSDMADSVAELLTIDGRELRVAREGDEALAVAQRFYPKLLLLALVVPKGTVVA